MTNLNLAGLTATDLHALALALIPGGPLPDLSQLSSPTARAIGRAFHNANGHDPQGALDNFLSLWDRSDANAIKAALLEIDPAKPPTANARVVRLADVQPQQVSWLWTNRVPLGKITVFDGDPGLGKSVLTMDLTARVSRSRPMPDGHAGDLDGSAGIVLMTAEDGLADTIRPRLEAAGADLSRVVALQSTGSDDGDRPVTLQDIDAIEAAIRSVQARLVVIDPLMAFLPGEVNSYRDQDVRRILRPISDLAERTGAAIVLVRHLSKAAGVSPLYRGGGSIGIIGAARSGLLIAKDPDDPEGDRRILAGVKSNLGPPPQSLAYRLEPVENGAVRIRWEGTTTHTAGQLLAIPVDDESRSALDEAVDFLREVLSRGPRPAKDVKSEARSAGIAERTLDRAKSRMGVRAQKHGFTESSTWLWELPEHGIDADE